MDIEDDDMYCRVVWAVRCPGFFPLRPLFEGGKEEEQKGRAVRIEEGGGRSWTGKCGPARKVLNRGKYLRTEWKGRRLVGTWRGGRSSGGTAALEPN